MRALVGLIGLALLATVPARSEEQMVLNGTSWIVSVDPDGMAKEKGEKGFRETMTFVDGKFTTGEGQKIGFESVPYKLARSGEKDWSFTVEQKNPTQGTYTWSGTAHGDDIRGKLVWTRSDRSVLTYTFKGDKKK